MHATHLPLSILPAPTAGPITVRIAPDERALIEDHIARTGCSVAQVTRAALRRGLNQLAAEVHG